jgi:peptidoglycan/LPS O-acetylase OafA/YrhL
MSTEPIEGHPSLVDRLTAPTVRRLGWNPALDGARGVSVVLVMSFHFLVQMTDLLDGTPILVDMFFVLSGFLITTLLFEERSGRGAISLRDFYLRRVFRLFPAVYALLAVFTLVVLFAGGEHRGELLAEALTAALYVYNLFIAWVGVEGQVLIQLWTLSLEEQFYFVWPLLLIAALKVRSRRRMPLLIGAMAVVVVVLPLLRMGLEPELGARTFESFVFGLAIMRPDSLVLGCLAALLFRLEPTMDAPWLQRWLPIAGKVALALYAGAFLLGGLEPFRPFVSPFYNLAVLGMPFFVLDLVRRPNARFASMLAHPICGWFGKRSYGIYIWHLVIYFPIQAFFNDMFVGRAKVATLAAFPFSVAATIGVAVLSWNYIETPALRIKARYARSG